MRTKKIIFLLLLLVFFLFTSGCLGGFFNNKPIIGSTPETTIKVGIEYTYEIVATFNLYFNCKTRCYDY
jgi:hypothetical protein